MTIKLNNALIPITEFYENLNGGASLTAVNNFVVETGSEFPDLADLDGTSLTECVITNADGVRIPTQGLYKRVNAVSITYNDRNKYYTANIVLGTEVS